MSITQLKYILAVDKHKHFGKAAEACYITQPTLSMQIQKYEEEMGVIIFDRSKNPIKTTLEGEKVIEQAKIVIREHNKITHIIQEGKTGIEGSFKLAVIPTLSPYLIPLFAKNFAEKYPAINLIIEEAKTEDIIKLLDNDEIDAGLLVTPLHKNFIIEKPLYNEPFYLFVSNDNPLSKKKTIKEEDLKLEDIWLLNKGNCFRDQVLNICSKNKNNKDLNENLNFAGGSFETLKNMVIQCSGYTILPHMGVNQLSEEQKKMVRKFEKPVPIREVSIVYSRAYSKKKIIKLIEKEILLSIPEELKKQNKNDIELIEIY